MPGRTIPNSDLRAARRVDRFRAPHRRRADHLERMEARLLQQLQLADVIESVELEDEAGVGAGGDVPAAVFVIVQKAHPDAVVVLPLHLVGGRPVEPVRAVRGAARLVPAPQRRQRVAVMPFGAHGPHQIAAGFVDRQRRIDVEFLRHQLVDDGVPLLAAGSAACFQSRPASPNRFASSL